MVLIIRLLDLFDSDFRLTRFVEQLLRASQVLQILFDLSLTHLIFSILLIDKTQWLLQHNSVAQQMIIDLLLHSHGVGFLDISYRHILYFIILQVGKYLVDLSFIVLLFFCFGF